MLSDVSRLQQIYLSEVSRQDIRWTWQLQFWRLQKYQVDCGECVTWHWNYCGFKVKLSWGVQNGQIAMAMVRHWGMSDWLWGDRCQTASGTLWGGMQLSVAIWVDPLPLLIDETANWIKFLQDASLCAAKWTKVSIMPIWLTKRAASSSTGTSLKWKLTPSFIYN